MTNRINQLMVKIRSILPFLTHTKTQQTSTPSTAPPFDDFDKPARDFYGSELSHLYSMAHCDYMVLHAPGECQFCDRHPKQQEYRRTHNINFTGEKNPNKRPCPAELIRGDICQEWGGNKPVPEGADGFATYYGAPLAELLRAWQEIDMDEAAERRMLDEGAPDLL